MISGMRLKEQCLKRGLVLENGKREVWGVRMQRTALSGEVFFVPLSLSGEGKVSTLTFYKNSLSRLGNGGYFSPAFPRCIFIIGDEYNLWNR